MAVLSAQEMPVTGFSPTFGAASSGGDEIAPGNGVFAVVKNGSSASVDVTASIPVAVHAAVDVVKTVAAGAEVWIPLPERNYQGHEARSIKQTSTNNAALSYSATSSVTVAAVKAL